MRPPHGVETAAVSVSPEVWIVNRIQALVLGFFAVVLAILVGILTLAPDVYDAALQLPADVRLAEIGFLAALTAFIGLLAVGSCGAGAGPSG